MNGKISKYGQLFIDRKKSFKAQTCCRSNSDRFDTARACSDGCPAFHEPVDIQGKTRLMLCSDVGMLYFDNFSDER